MSGSRILPPLLGLGVVAAGVTAFIHRHDRPLDPAPIPLAAPMARVVDVLASNYAFRAPDTVEAGTMTFRLTNQGTELHHLVIVALSPGKGVADLLKETHGEEIPGWVNPVGGPNAIDPGSRSATTVTLAPGRYAMICIIPSPDGVIHMMKGMTHEFTVVGAPTMAGRPQTDLSMRLVDYGFTLSGPLTAGHHEIAVQNDAQQIHELVVFKLAPGKHLTDLLAWFQHPEGAPPASAVGGASPLAPGTQNIVSVDLTPGTYGLICFLPDAKDHAPHLAHGMMKEVVVE